MFHLDQNCSLQTLSVGKRLKFVIWERVNPFPNKPWFLRVCSTSLLKTLGKGEIARSEQFLLFPVFSALSEDFLPFSLNSKLSSANSFSLEESKICCLGKGYEGYDGSCYTIYIANYNLTCYLVTVKYILTLPLNFNWPAHRELSKK